VTKLTIDINPWALPSPPLHFEGRPSQEERAREEAEAAAQRASWTPGPRALALLDELQAFVGQRVVIQGWDPIMYWMEDEGPHPIIATCTGTLTRVDGGHLRAYLVLQDPVERPTPRGTSGLAQLVEGAGHWLFGLDKLLSVELER
jgi:hypothetical protein